MAGSADGILSGPIDLDGPRRPRSYREVEATVGLDVVHRASGLRGLVVGTAHGGLRIRDTRGGGEHLLRVLPGGFLVQGEPVTLVAPRLPSTAATGTARTPSGSVAVAGARPRVAQASRILVEGVHDAALVERVWGDDLRIEGVVVERLDGMDHLAEAVLDFAPGPGRRLGVLLDHLVEGSKEARAAAALSSAHVLVTGTPFVDVWEAVKPAVVGIGAWPRVPHGTSWKEGVCAALGTTDPAALWRRILGSVHTYADLEPALVGAVERLIDFVTDGSAGGSGG